MTTKGEYVRVTIMTLSLALGLTLVLGALVARANAQEVSSIRDSSSEWQCETRDGTVLSSHTRQDKAFQACFNRALASGDTFIVRGGTFRVSASGVARQPDPPPPPPPPPVEPDPPPPVEPPGGVLVSFGPTSDLIVYPAEISALKRDRVRWQITFSLNSLPDINNLMGLASRDEIRQPEAGHLSIWVDSAGLIHVRHQDIAGGAPSVSLVSLTTVVAGNEYRISVSIDIDAGMGLFVDGVLEDSSPVAFGLTGNDLPLVVGGLCLRCTADGSVGPDRAADGTVFVEIFADPLSLPEPASIELTWTNPTLYEDETVLDLSELTSINLFQIVPGPRRLLVQQDPDVSGYEVTGLLAGVEYCFVATATAGLESDDSNGVCKTP